MGVLFWKSLVAINYSAKNLGINRGMTINEALDICSNMMFVNTATLYDLNGQDIFKPSSVAKVQKVRLNNNEEVWKVEGRD